MKACLAKCSFFGKTLFILFLVIFTQRIFYDVSHTFEFEDAHSYETYLARLGLDVLYTKHQEEAEFVTFAKSLNREVNGFLTYTPDSVLYGVSDYWATPKEIQETRKGDCEEYAFLFFFTLKALHVKRVYLGYGELSKGGGETESHMVAMVYEKDMESTPLVFDVMLKGSTTSKVTPLSALPSLRIYVVFDERTFMLKGDDVNQMQRKNAEYAYKMWREYLLRVGKEMRV